MLTPYEIVFMSTNILGVYIVFKLLRVFFNEARSSRRIEFLSYAGYYMVDSVLFFLARIPAAMLCASIVLLFFLTLNYRTTMKKRVLCTFLACMILTCAEVLGAFLTGLPGIALFEGSQYASAWGLLVIRALSLMLVAVMSGLKNISKEIPVPNFYWFSMVFIPIASLYLFAVLFHGHQLSQAHSMAVVAVLLAINFIVLFLYDNLAKAFSIRSDKMLLEQQNNAYRKHMEMLQQSWHATQAVRHDMKNHLITLSELCKRRQLAEAEKYFSDIITVFDGNKEFVDSGNPAIDSIVNLKLREAVDIGAAPEIDVVVPQGLELPHHEVTIILGNLLDNALAAIKNHTAEKNLSVSIKFKKDNLIITVVNSYDGKLQVNNGKLVSTKKEGSHGLGLTSVKETLSANGGYLDIRHDGQIFKAIAIFPIFV